MDLHKSHDTPSAASGLAQAQTACCGASNLVKLLTDARRYIERNGEETGYGYYRPANPHDFHPDGESCSEEEIAAHKAACEAYDKGEYTPEKGSEWVTPNLHILRAPWGIGSYTYRDEWAVEIMAGIDAHLASEVAL